MGTHHLILGETTDFISGKTIKDTHDERARQKIAKYLVEDKGYKKTDIHPRMLLQLEVDGKTGQVPVDFVVKPDGRALMLIMVRPGSLVSRRRSAIAAARLLEEETIPFAAVTNAEEAEIMETSSGKVVATGLDGFFSRAEAPGILAGIKSSPGPEEQRREKEKRIIFAMEVLAQKECDDYKCGYP